MIPQIKELITDKDMVPERDPCQNESMCSDQTLMSIYSRTATDYVGAVVQNASHTPLFVFRSGVPSHPNCQTYRSGPLSRDLAKGAVAGLRGDGSNPEFAWNMFQSYDKELKKILSERNLPCNVKWLDPYSALAQRAEQHTGKLDCLHYRVPGPDPCSVSCVLFCNIEGKLFC